MSDQINFKACQVLPCCSDSRNSSQPRILYTCSAQDEPERETALGALDLAHRWQVEAVVAILTDLLAGAIFWGIFSGFRSVLDACRISKMH